MKPDQLYQYLHHELPHLASAMYFKSALELLDRLNPTAKTMPMRDCFTAGYLSILHRDPERGKEFIKSLKAEGGAYLDDVMDPFYAIKKVGDKVFDRREMERTTPAQRDMMILACVLNSFEAWKTSTDFKADEFPMDQRVIATFNPALRDAVSTMHKTAEQARVKDKQKQAEQRRPTRMPSREHAAAN